MKKFNIGSGPLPLHDYICIDDLDIQRADYTRCNLNHGLPPECKDADMIYSSHVFEHFTDPMARRLMTICYEHLAPNGVFRICLPNFRDLVEHYLAGDWGHWNILNWDEFSDPATRSLIDVCSFGVYQPDPDIHNTHKSIWDVDKTIKVLTNIGFREVKEVSYDFSIDPPNELRRRYSLVVEGIK